MSLVDFEHSFDLDGKVERQARTPDDKAGMAPAFAKDGNDEVGGAVHHKCLLIELGRRIDETAQPDAAPNPVEIAVAGVAKLHKQVEHDEAGCRLSLLEGEIATKAALETKLVAPKRTLDADDQIAGANIGQIVADRTGAWRKFEAKIAKALLDVGQDATRRWRMGRLARIRSIQAAIVSAMVRRTA